jgi:DNA-binding PadR family transcriptional regulator
MGPMYSEIPRTKRWAVDRLLGWGIIHLLILRVLVDEGECWRNRLSKLLYERYGVSIGSGSLYSKLFVQERLGYVRKVRTERRGGAPPRKVYVATEKGRELLESSTSFLAAVLDMLGGRNVK